MLHELGMGIFKDANHDAIVRQSTVYSVFITYNHGQDPPASNTWHYILQGWQMLIWQHHPEN